MVAAAWLVRGGRDGEREVSSLDEGLVIAGWDESGDLTHCSHKEQVRELLVRAHPDKGKATIANWTGQLWRLVNEIKHGDVVVMPLKTWQKIAVGRVAGAYRFREEAEPGFRHVRPVEWIRTDVDRSGVRQDLLNSMGSLLTVCQLRRFGAARRVAQLAEQGVDPGPTQDELPQQGVDSVRELLDRAVASGPESPLRLSIRELLSCWGAMRRTPAQVARIETDLAELGLTTRPPFTDGWIDNRVEVVPVGEEPGDADDLAGFEEQEEVRDVSEFPAITLRVGMLKSASEGVASVRPDDVLATATTRMVADNFSQLAVIDDDDHLHGGVSWETIGKAHISKPAAHISEATVPARAVEHHEDLLGQLDEIFRSGFVFVRGMDRRINGIVTAADLTAQFGDLARPFVLIEEAERRIRRRVDEVFALEEIQCAGRVNPDRRVSSAADLTLGKYGHLLTPRGNWTRLGWPLDHELFLSRLEEVRVVRNELMHFTPDPLNGTQLETLEGLVRILRTVDPRG